jgi:hypothetical protein
MSSKISINDFKLPLLEDYVRSHILVFLNRPRDSFSLQPTTLGNHNAIFLLFIGRFPSLILKGYPKINWYKKALNGSRLLAQHGIRVPRLYYTDSSEACFKTFGCHFICEEKIVGKSLAECGAIKDYIPAVAHCYAKMHQIRNSNKTCQDKNPAHSATEYPQHCFDSLKHYKIPQFPEQPLR